MRVMRVRTAAVAVVLLAASVGSAQKKGKDKMSGYDRAARATLVHPAIVYITADDSAQHLAEVDPGARGGGDRAQWRMGARVRQHGHAGQGGRCGRAGVQRGRCADAGVGMDPRQRDCDAGDGGWRRDPVWGWRRTWRIEAAQPHAPKDAAEEAHLLYQRVAEYFPDSPLAAEAMYRSADVRWQLDKADISTLPSAKEQEAYLRPQIYEGDMQQVMKLYPGSKEAALAAYDLLDNKLCGDWQGLPKCPEMEARLYEKYADRYPDSPKAAQALYEATYREGVLVEMYLVQEEKKRSDAAVQAAVRVWRRS